MKHPPDQIVTYKLVSDMLWCIADADWPAEDTGGRDVRIPLKGFHSLQVLRDPPYFTSIRPLRSTKLGAR